jgi:arylsulfatase A-like enzyme
MPNHDLTDCSLARIRVGFLSALIAGALVGIVESIVVARGSELHDLWLFCWSAVVYGLLALPIGVGFGVLGGIVNQVRRRAVRIDRLYSFYLTATFTVMLLVIGRFRIIRDVYHEISPGMSLDLKLLAGAAVLFLVLHQVFFRFLLGASPLRRITGVAGSLAAWLVIIAAAALVSSTGDAPEPRLHPVAAGESADRPNVLLIIVDTLRADRLPPYGYAGIEAPAFGRLATDGIVYRHAFAQASWTKPSIAAIMTGLYPSTHQAVHKNSLLPDDVTTLAEALQAAGYTTVGLPNNENIFPTRNFQQGFDVYDPLEPEFFFHATESAFHLAFYNQLRLIRERFLSQSKHVEQYYQDAAAVNRRAGEWLEQLQGREGPFFLFLHYMEPHDPYFPHPYDGTGYARVNNPNPSPDLARVYSDTYDGEIAYLDAHLGELFLRLEEAGLYDDLLIVLTADHGEEFHEHDGWWHGTTLYDEQIHVPLMVKLPGNAWSGAVIDALVRSIDIPPSILTAAGAPIPPAMQGHDVFPDSSGSAQGQVYVFSEEDLEGNVLQSVRGSEWKLILANEGNPRGLAPQELYHMTTDPGETTDLASREPEVAGALREQASETAAYALEVSVEAQEAEHSDVERERLKALGYVQ